MSILARTAAALGVLSLSLAGPYAVEAGADAVGAFSVNGGTLTEIAQSPFALPAGATPFGLAVTGAGELENEQ